MRAAVLKTLILAALASGLLSACTLNLPTKSPEPEKTSALASTADAVG